MARKSRGTRAAIRRLERKAYRANGWLIASLSFLVVGPLMACGGVNVFGSDGPGICCCFVGIFSPFVALGGLLLMGGDRARWNRALGFARAGDDLGLDYTEEPGRSAAAFLRGCATIGDAEHELRRNRLEGSYRGRRVRVMDYRSGYGGSNVVARTTIVWDGEARGVPRLALYPRGWRQKLADAVGAGGGSIRLAGEREFNDAYVLQGTDADAVAACFTDELIGVCLEERSLVVEALDGSLLVYWDGEEFPPADLPDRLATALRVLKLLAPHAEPDAGS
ncbi:hypothetical protein [Urbifossiella limnaea]|uniref:DUF3137 domain-containing protein n=1 Tax=Urbifossiella limnaea TaxID=2528023 RepID=A0A517XYR7_9BACT|nr:hypothetical protein [Urbifossiella limnaea]QDU22670.1 hypothetical protein ETAA1_46530 [Urbifossiella limnaea]